VNRSTEGTKFYSRDGEKKKKNIRLAQLKQVFVSFIIFSSLSIISTMSSSVAATARGALHRQYSRGSSSGSVENLPPRTLARVSREVRDLHKSPPEGVRLVVDGETGLPSNLGEVMVSIVDCLNDQPHCSHSFLHTTSWTSVVLLSTCRVRSLQRLGHLYFQSKCQIANSDNRR
jgi:hypothetical protein